MEVTTASQTNLRIKIELKGIVQGVGFRPFVWRLASELGLVGSVYNHTSGVTIEVQGYRDKVDLFCDRLRNELPPLAVVDSLVSCDVEIQDESEFVIRGSVGFQQESTAVSPDISVCVDCLLDVNDQNDRRYQYPFTNCTNCGPRYTIVEDIPYDRANTTMSEFPMCRECQREYDDPRDRRFHAQPNACSECGPGIWFVDSNAAEEFLEYPAAMEPDLAIASFKSAIKHGKIIAVKGIGGFHLVCDAANEKAIDRLRDRKGRVDKPFAVMVRDTDQARSFAVVSPNEQQLLESRERPIVLLNKRAENHQVAANVSPGNNFVGVMLPYSPLHYLLLDDVPLLVTSGNISDEPIVRTNGEARTRLRKLADVFLLHNRGITRVCDDSVVRCVNGDILQIRRSRGYTPMPVRLQEDGPDVLAVGGEIKATFCATRKDYAMMSPHIGDMANVETLDAMKQGVEHFLKLFRVTPQAIAADLHPGYLSSEWAESFSQELDVPLFRVQHHFAHVVSLIAEHGLPKHQRILGCCFDGTGYGEDGTIWGGEFLIADSMSFDRFAHLARFPLCGGEASIKRPGRIALSLLWANRMNWHDELAPLDAISSVEQKVLRQQLEKNLNCVPTSSMGRLFDAVASLVGIRHEVNYEAQAAMELEALAAPVIDQVDEQAFSFELSRNERLEMRTERLLKAICMDLQNGVPSELISAKFHHAVTNAIFDVCSQARIDTGIDVVGLTGGVFQNALLLELAVKKLRHAGFRVLTHSVVPPNDGGIALGQAVVARNWLEQPTSPKR